MSARHLYLTLPYATRCQIDREVLRRAGVDVDAPADAADPLTLDDVLAHEDDPALVAVLRDVWWPSLTTGEIARTLDASAMRDHSARELAIVLCAETVVHLTTEPRVVECCRIRLAYVGGKAPWNLREAAIESCLAATNRASIGLTFDRAQLAAIVCAETCLWDAASAAAKAISEPFVVYPLPAKALAPALRTLYPDPTRLDYRDALTRWDVAVAQARAAAQVTT